MGDAVNLVLTRIKMRARTLVHALWQACRISRLGTGFGLSGPHVRPIDTLEHDTPAMQSKATTVEQYLAELPEDRRKAIEAVRQVVLKNLDKDYEEGIQYGMIGYYVPHRVYPQGYHCDPKQPLPFAGLGSQKNHMSLYLMCIYGATDHTKWFQEAWAKTGKKLDMGKACVRFKKIDDLALDVIGEAIKRVPAQKYIAYCEAGAKSTKDLATSGKTTKPAKSAAPPRKSPRSSK
jgi:hypothetical protein